MKLIYRIVLRMSLAMLVILGVWAFLFYYTIIDEVNDETDDVLENYAERIMTRALAGKELPSENSGSNNSYHLMPVTEEYAELYDEIRYMDSMVYIPEEEDTEPARVLKIIFKDEHGQYFELTVSTPTIEKEDMQEAIRDWVIFLYLFLLIVLAAINVWVVYRSMKPLYKLLRWLNENTVGNPQSKLDNPTRITEFRKLNEAVSQYAERAERLFEQQKQFIGNASHEIQTPIAVCQNRLDMLVDHTTLSEEQLEEILKTQQTLDYISKLNKSLLFLSRIDNRQFPSSHAINLNEVIRRFLEDYQEIYAYKELTVTFHEQRQLTVEMNDTLVRALISNLLRNAFIHNTEKGYIRIELKGNTLIVANGGTAPLDAEHIFERFYQGSKKEGSTGLGLAIADAICKMYGARLEYRFAAKEHRFCITFS